MNGPFVSLNYACEESIVDYLIAQCDPLQTTASYYTGVGNVEELVAPAVMVTAENGTETHPFSKCYDMQVQIFVKEIAADASGSTINTDSTNPSLGRLSANIFNAIHDPSMSFKVNLNNTRNFVSAFIQKPDIRHSLREDALISEMTVRVIGSLSGSI